VGIKGGEVRPEGCICEPCSDISPNWEDIRSEFGYTNVRRHIFKSLFEYGMSENFGSLVSCVVFKDN